MNRQLSVAPMMSCTDRHFRSLLRQLTQHTLLYTEMVTTGAVIHGDRERLLGYADLEHPLACQLGGSDPVQLAEATKIVTDYGYDEVNLNIGCPSDRVQAGKFGACLMKEPALVADCVAAMQAVTDIPVTVKTRIGVDDQDSYAELVAFIEGVKATGCDTFILHARKAWLQGLSPRDNRNVPPLRYDVVYQLKQDFPDLEIIINGGVNTFEDAQTHLTHIDGVMIGRAAYSNPYLFATADQQFFESDAAVVSPLEAVLGYLPYVAQQLQQGVPLRRMSNHLIGLFPGVPGARAWRRYLSEHAGDSARGVEVIETALQSLVLTTV